jgi:hypothetical protein
MVTMPGQVAPEAAARIRRPAPVGCSVIEGSLPVVSFGSPGRAHVATLSLNPSDQEFLTKEGAWLLGSKQRLESLVSLGVADPRDLTDDQVAQVVDRCERYFDGPSFGQWFGHLDRLMTAAGIAGYRSRNACHLDLIQWSTNPTASSLPAPAWRTLLDDDLDFLTWQLSTTPVDVILINGAGPLQGVKNSGVAGSFTEEVLPIMRSNGPGRIRVARATAGKVLYLAWNLPLDKGLSVDGVEKLSGWVRDRIAEHDPTAFGEASP